jgi:hypothetical protein
MAVQAKVHPCSSLPMFVNYILISSGAAQRRLLKKDFYQQKVDFSARFQASLGCV